MKEVVVLAINRAEPDLSRACKLFEKSHNVKLTPILLVDTAYAKSPVFDGNESHYYFREVICDFSSKDEVGKILEPFVGKQIILNCRNESAIKDLRRIILYLKGTLSPTVESLMVSTDKSLMRKAFSDNYPEITPTFVKITNETMLTDALIFNLKFPVIVKPNGLNSSYLVKKCSDAEELNGTIKAIFKSIHEVYRRYNGTGAPSVLIEEFMVGEMYSTDVYIDKNGKTWCLPLVRVITAAELGLDGYYSYRHIVPVDLPISVVEGAFDCAKKAIKAVGLTVSTAHVELYKTAEGWKIIELAPRIGGYRQSLYYEAYGIEHFLNDLLIHYGEEPDITPKWHKYAAGFNIYAPTEGVIETVVGYEEARKVESFVRMSKHAEPGQKAVFASKGGAYLVDGILSNKSAEKLEADMKFVRDTIRFKFNKL